MYSETYQCHSLQLFPSVHWIRKCDTRSHGLFSSMIWYSEYEKIIEFAWILLGCNFSTSDLWDWRWTSEFDSFVRYETGWSFTVEQYSTCNTNRFVSAKFCLSALLVIALFLAKYVGSLARIRTGISDAFVSCDVLELLIQKLNSPSLPQTSEDAGDEIEMRSACAVGIGALTYNRTAFRLLYNLVRRNPGNKKRSISLIIYFFIGLYEKIIAHGQRSCLSPEFITFFESERAKGLPVDRLYPKSFFFSTRDICLHSLFYIF